jgi:tRNA(Ile)-lysidine synthase
MSVLELTQQTIQQHKLIPPGSVVVVGVSGGTDSLALLHILLALRSRLSFKVHVATLDHGWRGQSGADDVQFVVAQCAAWDVPVTSGTMDPQQRTTEQTARTARYDFLADVARQVGAARVAVAHHADDQTETVLMHVLRGSGLQGLTGMKFSAPLPGHPHLTLIRPLLAVSRADLEAYCQAHNLHPRQDTTNLDPGYLRNRLRLDIMPQLRATNPQLDQALTQLAAIAAVQQDYMQQQLQAVIAHHAQVTHDRITLDAGVFAQLHPALQQQYILWAAAQVSGVDLTYRHVTQAIELAHTGQVGQRVPLPGKVQLRLDYHTLVIERTDAPAPLPDQPLLSPETMLTVTVPGETPLPDADWVLYASPEPLSRWPSAQLKLKPNQIVRLRTRQPGDKFEPWGLHGHTQTLKKWLIDHKIPSILRSRLPLITIDGAIAAFFTGTQWVISEKFVLTAPQEPTIYFQFIKRNIA